ncbi:carbohydrate ABC transporter permease [Gordonia sp. (in: high G+C Gram-positive bacteria)]|uniref:carbohydrate ABC transporter permease n=1 Tax=Gordonia sp. (in: high G+C Gram-positive bacteria) TaxID=84139 RepID=UPI003527F7CF
MTTGDDDTTRANPADDEAPGRHSRDDGPRSAPANPPAGPGETTPVAPVHSDAWVPPAPAARPVPQAPPIAEPAPPAPVVPADPARPAPTSVPSAATGSITDLLDAAPPPPSAPVAVAEPKRARGATARKAGERRLAYLLVAPAAIVMLLVTGYPIVYAFWLSLNKATLTAPDDNEFIGFSNYVTVLSDGYWWNSLWVTLFITVVSVAIELVLGMMIALVMHRTIFGRGTIRTVVLIPYGIVTVAAAFSWYYAWTPGTGYLANLLPDGATPPLTEQWPSLFIIILAEVWKTTPFMALLLLAGLALVPDDLLKAAQVDGAGAWTRLRKITLPLMKPAILVALLFRTLDAFRIFDNIYILTKGNNETGSVSMLGYDNLFKAFNLGVGSAISILIFVCVAIIAFVFIKIFGAAAPGSDNEGR